MVLLLSAFGSSARGVFRELVCDERDRRVPVRVYRRGNIEKQRYPATKCFDLGIFLDEFMLTTGTHKKVSVQ